MDIKGILTYLVGLLNFWPEMKTKLAAVAAFLLAVVAAWNSAAPAFDVDFVIVIPDYINAFVLALLGIGAANQPKNAAKSVKK